MSIWNLDEEKRNIKKLNKDKDVDILIIGAGLTGLNTAYMLKDSKNICVVDANMIGHGVTLNSTAKINYFQDSMYIKIIKAVGYNSAVKYLKSQRYAMSLLVDIIKKENVDMVICAADTPFLDIRISILEACISTKTPCTFGGLNIITGQYGPTLIDSSKMKNYYQELQKVKELVLCNNINKASFGPTNTIISAYMAIDIIMTLLGKKKYLYIRNK